MSGERKRSAQGRADGGFSRARRGRGEPADWALCDAVAIQATIALVAGDGGALRFGYSRDGGAYAVGVLGDGEAYTEYIRPSEDVAQWLAEFREYWVSPERNRA